MKVRLIVDLFPWSKVGDLFFENTQSGNYSPMQHGDYPWKRLTVDVELPDQEKLFPADVDAASKEV